MCHTIGTFLWYAFVANAPNTGRAKAVTKKSFLSFIRMAAFVILKSNKTLLMTPTLVTGFRQSPSYRPPTLALVE